jgi:GST-like protein
MNKPITLYTAPTPNGRKVSIALEEMELSYETKFVDIMAGGQHKPEFLALNPNNKFPVIEDPNGADGKPLILWSPVQSFGTLLKKQGCSCLDLG